MLARACFLDSEINILLAAKEYLLLKTYPRLACSIPLVNSRGDSSKNNIITVILLL